MNLFVGSSLGQCLGAAKTTTLSLDDSEQIAKRWWSYYEKFRNFHATLPSAGSVRIVISCVRVSFTRIHCLVGLSNRNNLAQKSTKITVCRTTVRQHRTRLRGSSNVIINYHLLKENIQCLYRTIIQLPAREAACNRNVR